MLHYYTVKTAWIIVYEKLGLDGMDKRFPKLSRRYVGSAVRVPSVWSTSTINSILALDTVSPAPLLCARNSTYPD